MITVVEFPVGAVRAVAVMSCLVASLVWAVTDLESMTMRPIWGVPAWVLGSVAWVVPGASLWGVLAAVGGVVLWMATSARFAKRGDVVAILTVAVGVGWVAPWVTFGVVLVASVLSVPFMVGAWRRGVRRIVYLPQVLGGVVSVLVFVGMVRDSFIPISP